MTFQNSFGEIFNVFQKHWDDFLGDCKVPTKHINQRVWHSRIWSLIKFLDVLLRSIGETVFVNNPFCGLLILVSIFIGHTKAGIGCALGGFIATLTDHMLGLHPSSMVDCGVNAFNGSLLGTVLPALFPLVSDNELHLWVAVCLGAFASVFVSSALLNSIGRLDAPFMTLPFNFIAIISFLSFQTDQFYSDQMSTPKNVSLNGSNDIMTDIEWLKVIEGSVLSMGQVYAVQDLVTSLMMWLAVCLYSPLLVLMSAVGAVIGTILPLLFLAPEDYSSVYSGLWGYSCILSMAAVAWAQFPFSVKSVFVGLVDVVCTVFAQKALLRNFSTVHLPVFTLPFTLPTLLIILSWRKQGQKWLDIQKPAPKVINKLLAAAFAQQVQDDSQNRKASSGMRDMQWMSQALNQERKFSYQTN